MGYKTCIDMAKMLIEKQTMPPEYSKTEGGSNSFNCYAYALLLSDVDWKDYEVTPGFMSGEIRWSHKYFQEITSTFIIQYVREDLKKLGRKMKRVSLDSPVEEGTYKIAIYTSSLGFHFTRQNKDGSWSEKCGWLEGIELIDPRRIPHYKLVGVYKIF